MVCKWQVEIDEYANQVLAKHWPNVRRWPDVRTWPQPDTERVDVICGGFPCQDISYAGKGAGIHGERSGLFFEAMRIVCEMEPRIVVLENVAALLTRGMGDVLGTLASMGFDAEWGVIPAAALGAPQLRERVFILAYTKGERLESGRLRRRGVRKARNYFYGNADSGKADLPWASWEHEPGLGRVANGVPCWVDRLRGLGNAVVPQVAEWIGRRIVEATEAQS